MHANWCQGEFVERGFKNGSMRSRKLSRQRGLSQRSTSAADRWSAESVKSHPLASRRSNEPLQSAPNAIADDTAMWRESGFQSAWALRSLIGKFRNGVRSDIPVSSPPKSRVPVGCVRQGYATSCQRKSQRNGPARSHPREIFQPNALAVATKSRACVRFPVKWKTGISEMRFANVS